MPVSKVQTPDGRVLTIEHPEGATADQILAFTAQSYMPEEPETTVLGATGEFLKGIPRGFASSFATAGQGLTELADAGLNTIGLEDAITEEDTQAVAGYVDTFQDALRQGPLGADPAYSDAFSTKFGEGLGSFASFLVPGGVLKGAAQLGKLSKAKEAATVYAGTGTLAVGTGSGQQAQRIEAARDRGIDISQEVEDQSIGLGAIIGLSELAPLERVLKAIPKSQLSGIIPRIESAVKTGGIEAVQELGAGLAQDFTSRGMYDPDIQIGESAWDDLTIGGAVGATADLLVNYAAGRKAKSAEQAREEAGLEEEALRREGQEGFEAGIRAEETGKKQQAAEVDRILEESKEEALELADRTPLQMAMDYREDTGNDISRPELEFKYGPIEDSTYNELIKQAREAETATPILALPSPDERKLAAQSAVQERMKRLGLSEDVQTKVVDVVRKVRTDQDGNLIFEADAMVEDETSYGTYMPTAKVIQLSIDQVFADAKGQPVTEEMVTSSLIKTLNHEVYHAIRNLDLVTQEEVELLEGLARKYRKKGTEGADGKPLSYASWAESGYSDLNSAKVTEEAVAEMISDSLAGNVMADGQTITIGGKPRNIIKRIVDFFKEMVGFTSSSKARNFSDFLAKLDTGEVGARERYKVDIKDTPSGRTVTETGEIRTPYLTDYARAEQAKRGVGRQRLADQPIVQLAEETEEEASESRRSPAYKDEVGRSVARDTFAKEIEDSGLESGAYIGEFEIDELNLTPPSKRLMRALERDDYLGFDRVDDLFIQLFDETGLEGYDASPQLKSAVGRYVNEMSGMTNLDRPLESRRTPFTSIAFEVAPDPNNKDMTSRWNSMSVAEQLMVSNDVGRETSQMVIEDTGAIAKVLPQIGSYLDNTNPSFAIKMDAGNPLDLAKNLGFALDQDSMMIMSSESFDNAFKAGAVDIDVGRLNQAQVDDIYQKLRGIEGIPKIQGQSTIDGKMIVLLDEGVDADKMARAFDSVLDGKYDVNTSEVFASFPEKAEYDYASPQVIPRENTADFRERYLAFRDQTQRRIADAVSKSLSDPRAGRGTAPNYNRTIAGALLPDGKLELSHYAPTKLTVTDPSRAGTGADRFKQNRPTYGTFFGVTKATENPYVKEPTVGNVENRFAVDAGDLYVVSDYLNPDALKDPKGVFATFPGGNVDYDSMLNKTKELGYKGFLIGTPNLGKVAVLNEPLTVIDDAMYSRRTPENIQLTTRKHSPQKVEEAVIRDEILAEDNQGFPRVNFQAESEAQYVAQDPDAGYRPQFDESQLASRRTPDRSQSYEGTISEVIGDRPVGPTQYETYQEATGEGKLDYWLTKFKQGAINRFARLEALNQDPALKENLADSSSIAAALFADRSRGVVSAAIKHGVPVYRDGITKVEDFSHNGVQYRGLIDLMGTLYSAEHGDLTKDAQAYAMAIRGKRLSNQGKDTPISKKQREEIILNAEQYVDGNGRSIIKDWYSAWQAYNNYTIRFLKDTGVLNNETAKLWQEYSDYVPFYRAASGEGNAPAIAQRVFGGDLTAKAHIKEYKGSKDKVDIPLTEAIGLNLTAAIEMGMRNVAQQRIIRDMQAIGLAKQLGKNEASTADLVTLKVDGKEVRFDVYDPLVFESMQSLPDQGFLVNGVFGAPARFLREMITRDPGFMMVNMLRDTLSTFTTSGSNFVPVVDTLRGYADDIDTLERTGVVGGYDYSNDPDNVLKFYQKEMKRRGIGPEGGRGSPLGMFTSIWDALGDATTRSDAATRNAVYKDVLARTGNEAEANFQALEVINFSRRGANALARVLTATIPFLNARFQGLDVFYRAGKGEYTANKELSRRQAIQSFVTRAGMLTALTALYYTLVSDDDQYKEQSEEIRDNNWIIPTASGVPVKIPIPFEVGLVFKTIPETILAATIGDKSSKEARDTIQRGIVSTLEINILGIQAISPLVEASMNHSFYNGRDIVPYYIDANVATGLQDRISTSEMGKFIGAELGISPIKVDHVMTGYGGTLGGYVLSAVDAILRSEAVTGDEAAKMPALKIYEYPVIKRFFASEQGSGLRQDAYELYREINKVVTTSNKLKKEGRIEELNSYLSSKQHLVDLKSPVYNIKGKLDQARRSRDAVMRMDINAERKREMIDDLDENINEMLKVIPALKKQANLPAFESRLMQRLTGG